MTRLHRRPANAFLSHVRPVIRRQNDTTRRLARFDRVVAAAIIVLNNSSTRAVARFISTWFPRYARCNRQLLATGHIESVVRRLNDHNLVSLLSTQQRRNFFRTYADVFDGDVVVNLLATRCRLLTRGDLENLMARCFAMAQPHPAPGSITLDMVTECLEAVLNNRGIQGFEEDN